MAQWQRWCTLITLTQASHVPSIPSEIYIRHGWRQQGHSMKTISFHHCFSQLTVIVSTTIRKHSVEKVIHHMWNWLYLLTSILVTKHQSVQICTTKDLFGAEIIQHIPQPTSDWLTTVANSQCMSALRIDSTMLIQRGCRDARHWGGWLKCRYGVDRPL